MTFGVQNSQSQSQSLQLLDQAFGSGINFFDTAEILTKHSIRCHSVTKLRGEVRSLGYWIRTRKIPRERVVIATKVSGPSGQMAWIRNGPESLDAVNIAEAIDNSYVPMFGKTENYPARAFSSVSFEEQLAALDKTNQAGKIQYIGLSNETPYGLMKFLHAAEAISGKTRVVSVQEGMLKGTWWIVDAEGKSRYNLTADVVRKVTESIRTTSGDIPTNPRDSCNPTPSHGSGKYRAKDPPKRAHGRGPKSCVISRVRSLDL